MTDLEEKALSDPAKDTIKYLGILSRQLLFSEDIFAALEV